jgi:hypothetical protein
MADVIGRKVFEIEIDGSDAIQGFKQVERQANKTATGMKTAFKEGGGGIKGILSGITGGLSNDLFDATEALGGLTKGFGALRGALIATGIGALVVAVGALIQNWDSVVGFMNRANSESLKNLELAEATLATEQKKLDSISGQENILKLQGKTEREILDLKLKQTDEVIAAQEAQLLAQEQIKKEQVEAAQRNRDILKGILQFITAPLQALLFTVDKVAEFIGQDTNLQDSFNNFTTGLLFDPEKVAAENDATINETREAIKKLKNDRAGLQLSINAIDKKGGEERKAQLEKELQDSQDAVRKANAQRLKDYEDMKAEEAKAAEARKTLLASIEDAKSELFKTAQQKEVDAAREKYAIMLEDAKAQGVSTAEIQFLQNEELRKINEKYADEEIKLQEEKDKKIAANKQALVENDIALTKTGIDALISLNEAFEGSSQAARKKTFKRNKALRIAQTLITTYQNATAAYASQLTVGDVTSPVRASIAAGFAVAQGLAQVAAIQKTKFDEGGGGGSASASGGGSPSFGSAPSESTPVNPTQNAQVGNQQTPQPIQAYVLSTNVTSAGQAQQKIDELSTL